MKTVTHLKKVDIQALWGKYHIEWHLNSDVNILAGINGSGKSTVLNLITGILQGGDWVINVDDWVGEVKITFNDNQTIHFAENIPDIIGVSRISTFDQPINTEPLTRKQSAPVKTDLDYQLFELQRSYLSYQINLGKRVEQAFLESDHIDTKTKREEIYGKKELFLRTINQLFEKTGKIIASDKNNEIVFRQEGEILTPYQLSSGEKQVLIILLSVLIQDNEPYILIMDEPEISLHIDWQETLIKLIRSLNNHVQVILATHSPGLVMKGWTDKVTEMEDITVYTL